MVLLDVLLLVVLGVLVVVVCGGIHWVANDVDNN